MEHATSPCCGDCLWWQRCGPKLSNATRDPSSAADIGTCQARSPVVAQADGPFPVSMFPQTHESRMCGEWVSLENEDDGGPRGGPRIIAFPAHRIAA